MSFSCNKPDDPISAKIIPKHELFSPTAAWLTWLCPPTPNKLCMSENLSFVEANPNQTWRCHTMNCSQQGKWTHDPRSLLLTCSSVGLTDLTCCFVTPYQPTWAQLMVRHLPVTPTISTSWGMEGALRPDGECSAQQRQTWWLSEGPSSPNHSVTLQRSSPTQPIP